MYVPTLTYMHATTINEKPLFWKKAMGIRYSLEEEMEGLKDVSIL